MEHIVVEGINTKTGGSFERKRYIYKKKKTDKSCPTNLSGKGEDMVADCSIVLFSTLWNSKASSFFGMFLATGGANSYITEQSLTEPSST